MKFEDLANELLLDLFEFFDLIHLLRAFGDLNIRFNQLLFIHSRRYRLNFQSISINDFKYVCQQYLPSIVDRIVSLGLSDDDETPHLPELFLSYGFTLDQFKYLEIFTLYSISSIDILNQLTYQCRHLQHLTYLYVIKCDFPSKKKDIAFLINNIWSISKLIYCHLDINLSNADIFTVNTTVSQSIKYLIMKNITCDLMNLSYLFQCTPYLERFCTIISCQAQNKELKNICPSIISLKLMFLGTIGWMKYLFQNMKNLSYLTLETSNIYLNGYEWEIFLVENLSQIKLFQFKMNFNFLNINHEEEQVDILLNSFRTHYWLEIRQQYVRCDWISSATINDASIYTLPYVFDNIYYRDSSCSRSTCPNEINFWSYNRVKTVEYVNNRCNFENNFISFRAQFINVHSLKIALCFKSNILSVYPSLNQLTTLDISLDDWSDCSQLQALLNRASHLYLLRLSKLSNFHMELFQVRSTSIRRLEFVEKKLLFNRYFDDMECTTLANSSLGLQCEVLLIQVTHRRTILNLINRISNLRMLIIECKDDKYDNTQSSSSSDELVSWLWNHLLSTCVIIRDTIYPYYIKIWIDCQQRSG